MGNLKTKVHMEIVKTKHCSLNTDHGWKIQNLHVVILISIYNMEDG